MEGGSCLPLKNSAIISLAFGVTENMLSPFADSVGPLKFAVV
jgi:hypothetical protein